MLVSIRLEIVIILTQDRCTILHRTYHRLINCFGHTQWNTLVMWAMWNLVLVLLKTMLVSVQDRCMVCAKRTIGS
jgi:hypothetical protein